MLRGLYITASGMITNQIKQENLTNNIANANTIGYKKDKVATKTFQEVLLQNYDKQVGKKNYKQVLGKMELGVGVDEVKYDRMQGLLENTERRLDFAINGEGYFKVKEGDNIYYTRNGRFIIDKEGYLATTDGKRLIGINQSNNREEEIKIDNENFEYSNGILRDYKNVYKFSIEDGDFKKVQENYYEGEGQAINNVDIKQGYIEKSNVDVLETMTEMLTIMRNYESLQKVMQTHDETLGKVVNEVGQVR